MMIDLTEEEKEFLLKILRREKIFAMKNIRRERGMNVDIIEIILNKLKTN